MEIPAKPDCLSAFPLRRALLEKRADALDLVFSLHQRALSVLFEHQRACHARFHTEMHHGLHGAGYERGELDDTFQQFG